MRHRFVTTDVFTNRIFTGNQLAVFPDARGIAEDRLQQIAREFNFSETTFVYPPENPSHTRRVRIFTPTDELKFAGHPTVGTAIVLATLGEVQIGNGDARLVLEEGVGPVPVTVRRDGSSFFCQLTAAMVPESGPPPPARTTLAELLGLDASDILGGMNAPQAFSVGIPFLFVQLKDRGAVAKARVRMDVWETTLRSYWAPNVAVFARDAEHPDHQLRMRVFVPAQNIVEDPATGSAAAALAGYLAPRDGGPDDTLRYVIEQGFEMGRPSLLELEIEKSGAEIRAVRVGGTAVVVSEGTIEDGN